MPPSKIRISIIHGLTADSLSRADLNVKIVVENVVVSERNVSIFRSSARNRRSGGAPEIKRRIAEERRAWPSCS